MKRAFVYLQNFDKAWKSLNLSDKHRIELEDLLLENPRKGEVIKGAGGLRKVRLGFYGKGKSGGLRILYVDFEEHERLYLLFVYSKNASENITEAHKQQFKEMIARLSEEIKRKG